MMVIGFIAERLGWFLKWFISEKIKQNLYHKFDTLFDDIVLRAVYNGASTKVDIIDIIGKTHLELFIINDSLFRLQKRGFVDFEDGK